MMHRAGRLDNFTRSLHDWQGRSGGRRWRHSMSSVKAIVGKRWVPCIVSMIGLLSLFYRMRDQPRLASSQNVDHNLWDPAPSGGWQASTYQRSSDWLPPVKNNGYLVVRCNGGLNQQRTAICNAVLVARVMNATLVLPYLDTTSIWHDNSGFPGVYDVEHFIVSLKNDVRVVRTLPTTWIRGNRTTKLRPFVLHPPRNAPLDWYETTALEELKKHGAIYLTPFSHRVTEELENHDYQRLRCRVNYHALRFTSEVRNLSRIIVGRLRSEGPYMAIHLRFELDMLAFAGCLDIFTTEEQEVLKKYRKENFADKELDYTHRRLIGKCPLTPEEVGLFLRAMGFDNSTHIYLASGEIFGGERFMGPLRTLFPHLETRVTVALPEELGLVSDERRGLLGPAVDYMVCLLSEIFVPTYDGPSNFANNLIGQRLYYGFRTTLLPDRKALAPLFINLEKGLFKKSDFETSVRRVMSRKYSGVPHARVSPESFYTNPWPECFCMNSSTNGKNHCSYQKIYFPGFESYDQDEDDNFAGWNI